MSLPDPPPDVCRAQRWRALWRGGPMVVVLILAGLGYWEAALGLFLTVFLLMGYFILSPTTRVFGPVVTHMPESQILITIDDGPHPDTTLPMLDALDTAQTKAVFFLIGRNVQRWPDLAREIVRRGHTIGNHTQTHPSAWFWALGPKAMWSEIAQGQQTLIEATGVTPEWFRAPVGHYGLFVHPVLKAYGLRLMGWSLRSFDTLGLAPEMVAGRVCRKLRSGDIVLLHEGRATSVAVLELVLRGKDAIPPGPAQGDPWPPPL